MKCSYGLIGKCDFDGFKAFDYNNQAQIDGGRGIQTTFGF